MGKYVAMVFGEFIDTIVRPSIGFPCWIKFIVKGVEKGR